MPLRSHFLRFSPLALLALVAFVAVAPLHAKVKASSKKAATQSGPAYKGAIVLDFDTGAVIFEDKADVVSPPASMTKLMTFAVLNDKINAGTFSLTTPITVTRADSKIGGTQVWLKEGEVFPAEELIYAMMIQSANDAAYALARTTAGSPEAFVELMNAKAKELGMTNTKFVSPHGLPPETRKFADSDQTSARDFALLCRYLLQNTDVLKYSSVKNRPFGEGVRDAKSVVQMVNHNHLLGKVEGVDGFKTGYTKGAGYCLSATALRNGRRVIVVTMGSTDRKLRDRKISELIEKGFANLPPLPTPEPATATTGTAATPASKATLVKPTAGAKVAPVATKSASATPSVEEVPSVVPAK